MVVEVKDRKVPVENYGIIIFCFNSENISRNLLSITPISRLRAANGDAINKDSDRQAKQFINVVACHIQKCLIGIYEFLIDRRANRREA